MSISKLEAIFKAMPMCDSNQKSKGLTFLTLPEGKSVKFI